jgi:NADH:ubiquinone oxidoreductase subunit E
MAWITKNSATMQVPRRAEPYLTEAMKKDLRERIIPRYETALACTMPGLHLIQHEHGWVPLQAMEELAAFLGIKPSDVLDTASFYEEYWLKPKGKHLVQVCRSIACEFCGQPEITKAIMDRLGIEVGETTDDGKFTLVELECLGACGGGPAVLIDETLHEHVKPGDIPALLEGAGKGGHH